MVSDTELVRAYRDTFLNTPYGLLVLSDLLSTLRHFDMVQTQTSAEVQVELEHQAKRILEKLGVFRYNNVAGYLNGLVNVSPEFYEAPEEEED